VKLHTYARSWSSFITDVKLLSKENNSIVEKLIFPQPVMKFPRILWKLNIHYLAHNSQLLVSIPSHTNPVHMLPFSLRSILILSFHLLLALPSGLFPTGFPTKTLYGFLFFPLRAACPAHPIFLDLINRIIFTEKHEP
jgi:hypothetical protein